MNTRIIIVTASLPALPAGAGNGTGREETVSVFFNNTLWVCSVSRYQI